MVNTGDIEQCYRAGEVPWIEAMGAMQFRGLTEEDARARLDAIKLADRMAFDAALADVVSCAKSWGAYERNGPPEEETWWGDETRKAINALRSLIT